MRERIPEKQESTQRKRRYSKKSFRQFILNSETLIIRFAKKKALRNLGLHHCIVINIKGESYRLKERKDYIAVIGNFRIRQIKK